MNTNNTSFKNLDVNILQPPTIWINRRCYRILLPGSDSIVGGGYVEDEAFPDVTYKDEMECEMDFDIPFEHLSNGKIRTSFAVASAYLPYIIGSRGATKHRIENETYTQIKIPFKGEVGDIVVIGKDLRTVRQARIRIELLVDQAKRRQPFTHFVSVPFIQDPIKENFMKFQKDVLQHCQGDRGIDSSVFQNPSKLHLTVCTLVLADKRERQEGAKALIELKTQIWNDHIEGRPMRVEVKGIEYMNDDPAEVDVLYGKVLTTSYKHSLEDMAEEVVKKLVKAGIASKQFDRVKLHVTLMNTLFRSDKDGSEEGKGTERETFDARRILKEFKDYYFGEVEASEMHLSIRYTTSKNGYYSPSSKVSLLPSP